MKRTAVYMPRLLKAFMTFGEWIEDYPCIFFWGEYPYPRKEDFTE